MLQNMPLTFLGMAYLGSFSSISVMGRARTHTQSRIQNKGKQTNAHQVLKLFDGSDCLKSVGMEISHLNSKRRRAGSIHSEEKRPQRGRVRGRPLRFCFAKDGFEVFQPHWIEVWFGLRSVEAITTGKESQLQQQLVF